MSEPNVDEMSFEDAMKELETVVGQLERGDVALDASIALYERGAALKARCEAKLKEAEEKVAKNLAQSRLRAASLIEGRVQGYAAELGSTFGEPFAYAVIGGKMLRGFMVCETARLHGKSYGFAGAAATAIECIHAYSLVHDDLPCMDDDDLRRGQPTIHKKWDEATAVLVGDALQSFAFEEVVGFLGSPEARLSFDLGTDHDFAGR